MIQKLTPRQRRRDIRSASHIRERPDVRAAGDADREGMGISPVRGAGGVGQVACARWAEVGRTAQATEQAEFRHPMDVAWTCGGGWAPHATECGSKRRRRRLGDAGRPGGRCQRPTSRVTRGSSRSSTRIVQRGVGELQRSVAARAPPRAARARWRIAAIERFQRPSSSCSRSRPPAQRPRNAVPATAAGLRCVALRVLCPLPNIDLGRRIYVL